MKDLKQAIQDAEESANLARKTWDYLEEKICKVLETVDEAVGASEQLNDINSGEPGFWIPKHEFEAMKEAYEQAW